MAYAKVITNGDYQLLLLPEGIRLAAGQVEAFRRGDEIVLRERPASAVAIFDALVGLGGEFLADGREDAAPQDRQGMM